MTTDQRFIERAEQQRDLRDQLGNLGSEESEIQFMEWSPGRKLATIWNMETGEEATLPRYQAVAAVNTRNARGGYAWTSDQSKAPPPRENNVKCFLHIEHPLRAYLDEIGVSTTCTSAHLASEGAMWAVARSKHGAQYKLYQEAIERVERDEAKKQQAMQTEAMLALAGKAVEGQPRGSDWLNAMESPVVEEAIKAVAETQVNALAERYGIAPAHSKRGRPRKEEASDG